MGFTPPGSIQQFAQEYGLNPFTIPNAAPGFNTGYTGAAPNGQGDLYVGPDGNVYQGNALGQEAPGTPSSGNYQSYAQNNPSVAQQGANLSSSLLPSSSQIAAAAPKPFQAFGAIPTVNPTSVSTQQLPGALNAFEGANAQALSPIFQAQDQSLQDNLGARGIVNSGAATYLNNQLAGQQAGALAGADSPLISQFAGYQNQANESNASAANSANALNAELYSGAVGGNQQAYNTYANNLLNTGSQYGQGLLSSYLNTYSPNTYGLSTLGQTPQAVGGAYQNAFSAAAPTGGFASGINQIANAFAPAPTNTTYSNDLQTPGPGGSTIDNQATVSSQG